MKPKTTKATEVVEEEPVTTIRYTVCDGNDRPMTINYEKADLAMTDALENAGAFARMTGSRKPKYPFKLYKTTTVTTTKTELEKEFDDSSLAKK